MYLGAQEWKLFTIHVIREFYPEQTLVNIFAFTGLLLLNRPLQDASSCDCVLHQYVLEHFPVARRFLADKQVHNNYEVCITTGAFTPADTRKQPHKMYAIKI